PTLHEQLLLRVPAGGDVVEVDLLELLEPLQTTAHRAKVGQHAAQPALVHVRHTHPGGLLGDGLLGLLLRADEQDGAAVGDGLLDELVRTVDVLQGLQQVDDVDAVAHGEDEALHLRVPTPGLVPEVHAALKELAHGDDGHGSSFLVWASPHVRARDQAQADSVDVLGGPYRRCPCLVRTIHGTGTRCRTSPRDPGAGAPVVRTRCQVGTRGHATCSAHVTGWCWRDRWAAALRVAHGPAGRPVFHSPLRSGGTCSARACCARPMRPDVPRPPREGGARPPVATPLARRVRVLLALALAGLVAMTIGAAQVPAAVDVPVPADVPANVPVPADAPAG